MTFPRLMTPSDCDKRMSDVGTKFDGWLFTSFRAREIFRFWRIHIFFGIETHKYSLCYIGFQQGFTIVRFDAYKERNTMFAR